MNQIKKIVDDYSGGIESQDLHDLIGLELEKHRAFGGKTFKSCFYLPCDIRIRERSLHFASLLILEKKSFSNLNEIIKKLEHHKCFLIEGYEVDNWHQEHILNILKAIDKDVRLKKRIQQIKKPFLNASVERILRHSLRLKSNEPITDLTTQKACLSALFHPLRQNVGSCFATAPAIRIQSEEMHLFLDDLENLLNLHVLKRVVLGKEISVPINLSLGRGDFSKPFVFTQGVALWNAYELKVVFQKLNLLDDVKSSNSLKDFLFSQVGLKLGDVVSFDVIIKKALMLKHFKKGGKACSSSSEERFERDYNLAQNIFLSLSEHALLKSWEYTLASFSEANSNFYKWNLCVGLGFDTKSSFGIGSCIYQYLNEKLSDYKKDIAEYHLKYEQEFYHVKSLEGRLKNIESEHMATWAKIEYQNHMNELNHYLKLRDDLSYKSEEMSKLLQVILDIYDQMFPQFFQEIYDAKMQDYQSGVYEDTPAGFRLVYKHGRRDPSVWSPIGDQKEFVNYLKDFFIVTEHQISQDEQLKLFVKEYGEIVTQIIHLIESDDFALAAFSRIYEKRNLKLPANLESYDSLPYKPWSYISGGSLETLLNNYYKREAPLHKAQKNIANPTELFSFLVESIREFSQKKIDTFFNNPKTSLLMCSPNHSFLCYPAKMPLKDFWEDKTYSYSWIRDQFVIPNINFLKDLTVSRELFVYFIECFFDPYPTLCLWLKHNLHCPSYLISLTEFRDVLFHAIQSLPRSLNQFQVNIEKIDSWIYKFFPVVKREELEKKVMECLLSLPLKIETDLQNNFINWLQFHVKAPFINSGQIFNILMIFCQMATQKIEDRINWPHVILEKMRFYQLAMPKPINFADSNWPYFDLSFVVHPTTHKLELWRTSLNSLEAYPMHQWHEIFNESCPKSWDLYTEFEQYSSELEFKNILH